MIPSSVECIHEKGSEEVPYSNDLSTHAIVEFRLGFAAQTQNIDCYVDFDGAWQH